MTVLLGAAFFGGMYFWTMHRTTSQLAIQEARPDCSQTGVSGGGGTIVAISGNRLITYDAYTHQTTTITIGPYTRYYQPDFFTAAPSSSLTKIGQVISASGYGCGWNAHGFPATIDSSNGFISRIPTLPDIAAPSGWYAHRTEMGAIVFTKNQALSMPSATEGFALGEQIDANAVILDHSPDDWAGLNIGNASGTIGAPPQSDWGSLGTYQTIKAEIGTEADNALIYAIFVPKQYTVYEFMLYPYPNTTDTPAFNALVETFARSLVE